MQSVINKVVKINKNGALNDISKYVDKVQNGDILSFEENNIVMLSKSNWDAIQETIYLLSIPKMEESIIEGIKTPLENCVDDVGL